MTESRQFIESILLEIVDRPQLWLDKGYSNKFNIGTFHSQMAALTFLKQYNRSSFINGEKIILYYNNQPLHLIVRRCQYGNIDKNSKNIPNTMVEFIYRHILFCQIKWPKILIKNQNQSQLDNNNQLKTIQQIINQKTNETKNFNDTMGNLLSLSDTIENSQGHKYKWINNFQRDKSLTLGHTNDEETHFYSSITIHVNQNDTNLIDF